MEFQSYVLFPENFHIYYYGMWRDDSIFVSMLLHIYEVRFNYKIIFFYPYYDCIHSIIISCQLYIIYCLVYIYWIDWVFSKYLFYFILLLFWFWSSDSISEIWYIFQTYFTLKNLLYNYPQIIWQCKWFFFTVTMAVNSPETTLFFVLMLCVWLSIL